MSQTTTGNDGKYRNLTQYAAAHDLQPYLIPFEHIQHDPWDVLLAARDYFDSLHDYAATWHAGKIDGFPHSLHGERMRYYIATLGSYKVKEGSYTGAKYVNPQYQHDMNLTCIRDRVEHLRYCSRHPLVTGKDFAQMYNTGRKSTYGAAKSRGIDWEARMKESRAEVANTMKLSNEWAGVTHAEMARAVGLDQSRVTRWIHDYATLETVPERPNEKWSA